MYYIACRHESFLPVYGFLKKTGFVFEFMLGRVCHGGLSHPSDEVNFIVWCPTGALDVHGLLDSIPAMERSSVMVYHMKLSYIAKK